MRSVAHIFTAPCATIVAVIFSDVPFNLGLITVGFVGMIMGAKTARHLHYTAVAALRVCLAP